MRRRPQVTVVVPVRSGTLRQLPISLTGRSVTLTNRDCNAHLVGHSIGGYMAIELARRGRAAAVCAFAPGGFWGSGDGLRAATMSKVQRGARMALLVRPIAPLVLKSSMARRLWFKVGACHGDRISAQRGVEIFDDFLGCTVTREIFSTDDEHIAPLDPLPCPATVAWSE